MAVSPHYTASNFLQWEGTSDLTFCLQFESPPQQKWHGMNNKGLADDVKDPSQLPWVCKGDMKHCSSSEWLSLHHIIPLLVLRGYLKSSILCENWKSGWQKLHGLTYNWLVDAWKRSSCIHYISKETFELLCQHCTAILTSYHSLSHVERVPLNIIFCVHFESQYRQKWHDINNNGAQNCCLKFLQSYLCI